MCVVHINVTKQETHISSPPPPPQQSILVRHTSRLVNRRGGSCWVGVWSTKRTPRAEQTRTLLYPAHTHTQTFTIWTRLLYFTYAPQVLGQLPAWRRRQLGRQVSQSPPATLLYIPTRRKYPLVIIKGKKHEGSV